VKEIIGKFNLTPQTRHMASKDVLLDTVGKFTSPYINLTPNEKEDPDGNRLPALTNLGMGYVFEELIRKFNEENNEEAGEHFTPREVIQLMTHLIFDPIKESLPPVMTIYDPACGSGGMLTESQKFIKDDDGEIRATGDVYLYGKEINDETYAICKSDMMIKGEDPANIRVGSTLSIDEFAGTRFDFMLSNPPYGKSWASEQKYIKDGKDVIDPRFQVQLKDYWGDTETAAATPRSSDGQLLFLMEMVSKMKGVNHSPAGSCIASVHNGSSLFTGDAGGGESNIRRHIIENDWLEAIIQLPNNLFYNTGITTYIWLLSNKKTAERQGKVQLIDASECFRKLRKNLGNKNCEFSAKHIEQIVETYVQLQYIEKQTDTSAIAAQVFDNQDFAYYKVNIERPDRRTAQLTAERIAPLRFDKTLKEVMQWVYTEYGEAVYQSDTLTTHEKTIIQWCDDHALPLNAKNRKKLFNLGAWQKHQKLLHVAATLMAAMGQKEHNDFNQFKRDVDVALKVQGIKLSASDKKAILDAVSCYDAQAAKIIKKKVKLVGNKKDELLHHLACAEEDLPDFGYFPTNHAHEFIVYEPCSDLRDSESIPLKDAIHRYFCAEVKPHVAEAWINLDSVKIGYEISFNKYFYRHQPLRSMEDVAADILALEKQAEGLIADILGAK